MDRFLEDLTDMVFMTNKSGPAQLVENRFKIYVDHVMACPVLN